MKFIGFNEVQACHGRTFTIKRDSEDWSERFNIAWICWYCGNIALSDEATDEEIRYISHAFLFELKNKYHRFIEEKDHRRKMIREGILKV